MAQPVLSGQPVPQEQQVLWDIQDQPDLLVKQDQLVLLVQRVLLDQPVPQERPVLWDIQDQPVHYQRIFGMLLEQIFITIQGMLVLIPQTRLHY
jgi:hypothetical protein